jgi:hypothetical protein
MEKMRFKMKKIAAILMIGLTLILSACATTAGAATPAEPTATPGIVAENYANALPVSSQLALGTIRLKDTPNAVSPEQAANLLFLWKGMQALSSATSASQIEINALLGQIQDTMKTPQLQSIAELKLSQADVQKAMADLGPAGGGAARAAGSGSTSSNRNQNQGGGNFQAFGGPGGAVPGGQGGGGNSQSIPPSTQATIQARAAQQSTRGNTLLYTAVVTYLETLVPAK